MDQHTGLSLSISCDDCSMQCSTACSDCVVTFVLREDEAAVEPDALVLSLEQARVVKLFGSAGLVPELKYSVAG